MKLRFIVPGPPVPKERPRRGKGGHFYTPQKTLAYEKTVGWAALAARQAQSASWPLHERYSMNVTIVFADDKGGDFDNVIKSIADGCEGVLWNNDRQIRAGGWAILAPDAARPRVEVEVTVR